MAYMATYSENMSTDFMQSLCPSAKLRMKCCLSGCRLVLRRIYSGAEFSVMQGSDEDSVPVVVWEIDGADEKDLMDFYPDDLFEKINFSLKTEKTQIDVFMFVRWGREPALPDGGYTEKIAAAYEEHGFDFWYVEQAMDDAADNLKGGKDDGTLHTGTD